MDGTYRLEKDYKISVDIFREGYRAYQKKYVYPKSYIFMGLFTLLALDFIYASVREPDNYMSYLLVVVCFGFAIREWYNPRKIRRCLVESYAENPENVYRLSVGDSYVDISTVSETIAENSDVPEDDGTEPEPPPEPTRIPLDEQFGILEYDEFFLLVYGKSVVYIIPAENFTEEEKDTVRNLKSQES